MGERGDSSSTPLSPAGGRGLGRGGGAFVQRCPNTRSHTFRICQYRVVAEPHDAKSFRLKKCGASTVILLLRGMLAAVEFDDKAALEANKIGDVRTNRILSLELESAETLRANLPPEFLLRVRWSTTHALGVRALQLSRFAQRSRCLRNHRPPPLPSPLPLTGARGSEQATSTPGFRSNDVRKLTDQVQFPSPPYRTRRYDSLSPAPPPLKASAGEMWLPRSAVALAKAEGERARERGAFRSR